PARTTSTENDQQLAAQMKKKANETNNLKLLVQKEKKLNKAARSIDVKKLCFPILSENYIRELTFGVYQIKQAKSYTSEHLDQNGNYMFQFVLMLPNLIQIRLQSRFASKKIHNIYIEFVRQTSNRNNQQLEPIKSWYCDCKAGARVVGTCAHVASVLWYLGVAIHDPEMLKERKCDKFMSLCQDASDS
ncbi:unnamed protein product, partial [Didymodactylos carnosus]